MGVYGDAGVSTGGADEPSYGDFVWVYGGDGGGAVCACEGYDDLSVGGMSGKW